MCLQDYQSVHDLGKKPNMLITFNPLAVTAIDHDIMGSGCSTLSKNDKACHRGLIALVI